MKFSVRVQPNASKSEIVGYINAVWKIRLKAPPVDGKANEALIAFLAKELKCTKSEISILKGQTGKLKIIEAPKSPSSLKNIT